jgi:predicted ester cyclase
MSIEENKAIVLRHEKEVLEQGHVELIESYYAPDGSVPGMDTPQQWRERVLWHHKTCPGFTITILDMMAEGEKVMLHTVDPPPSFFPPLGVPVSWRNMNVFRIVNGMLVAQQNVHGWKDMLVEVGVIPLKQIEHNKSAVRKFVDGVNTQNSALLAEVCTPEVAESWTEMLPGMYARMKDHHIELVDMVVDGDGVAVKMATSGYHTGLVQNLPATGKWWTNRVFAFFRFVNGQIGHVDLLPDAVNIAKQLGGTIQPTVI